MNLSIYEAVIYITKYQCFDEQNGGIKNAFSDWGTATATKQGANTAILLKVQLLDISLLYIFKNSAFLKVYFEKPT